MTKDSALKQIFKNLKKLSKLKSTLKLEKLKIKVDSNKIKGKL